MQELELTATIVKIKINGTEYESRMSDTQVMALAYHMNKKIIDLYHEGNVRVEAVIEAAEETVECIDMILGDGAAMAISGGKPVGANDAIRWLSQIAAAVSAAYAEKLVEMYA